MSRQSAPGARGTGGVTFITQTTPFSTQLLPEMTSSSFTHGGVNIGVNFARQGFPGGYSQLLPGGQAGSGPKAAATGAAVITPAVQTLVRKLLTTRRRTATGSGGSSAATSAEPTFELTATELSRWLAEAAAQVGQILHSTHWGPDKTDTHSVILTPSRSPPRPFHSASHDWLAPILRSIL